MGRPPARCATLTRHLAGASGRPATALWQAWCLHAVGACHTPPQQGADAAGPRPQLEEVPTDTHPLSVWAALVCWEEEWDG